MEHHWESGLSVLVRRALAPKAAGGHLAVVVVGMVMVVVGLEEEEEVDGADSKLPASYVLMLL